MPTPGDTAHPVLPVLTGVHAIQQDGRTQPGCLHNQGKQCLCDPFLAALLLSVEHLGCKGSVLSTLLCDRVMPSLTKCLMVLSSAERPGLPAHRVSQREAVGLVTRQAADNGRFVPGLIAQTGATCFMQPARMGLRTLPVFMNACALPSIIFPPLAC